MFVRRQAVVVLTDAVRVFGLKYRRGACREVKTVQFGGFQFVKKRFHQIPKAPGAQIVAAGRFPGQPQTGQTEAVLQKPGVDFLML